MDTPRLVYGAALLAVVLSGPAGCSSADVEVASGRSATITRLVRGCASGAATAPQPVAPSRPEPVLAMCR
jgi:hypothetical protein